MKKALKNLFTVLIFIFILPKLCIGGPYVEVGSSIYENLLYLEARGCIESAILTSLPLTAESISRLLEEAKLNCKTPDAYILKAESLIEEELPDTSSSLPYFKPLHETEAGIIYSTSKLSEEHTYNQKGDTFKKGVNLKVKFNSYFYSKNFSGYISPEVLYQKDRGSLRLKEAYGVLSFGRLNFIFGKQAMWWGPGWGGSIILSDNADPFVQVRIENNYPWLIPYLGLFKFHFFITRLGKNRIVPEPYLWGLRLEFKPNPRFTIGLSRTALLGGKGRSATLATWIKSFLARDENTSKEPGDQRAGFDVKLSVPNKWIPFETYLEAEGEDEAGGLPYKWAFISGIYFPKVPKLKGFSLRLEYASTDKAWYIHHIYRSGYTYKSKIIGYYIGRDARSFLLNVNWWWLEKSVKFSFSQYRISHHLTGEKEYISDFKIKKWLSSKLQIEWDLEYFRFKNYAGTGNNKRLLITYLMFDYFI